MSAWVRGNLLWKGRIFKKKSEIPQNDLTKPNIEGTVNITLRYICIGRGLASATPLAGISTDFLFYLLNARKSALVEQATGSTFISVTREQIKELLIPLPPLPEQEKIVSYIKQYETILKSIQE